MTQLETLLEEALKEGLGDMWGKLTGQSSGFRYLDRNTWDKLYAKEPKKIAMIANTPGAKDTAILIDGLFKTYEGDPQIGKLRQNLLSLAKAKKLQELAQLIKGLQAEARQVQSVKGQSVRGMEEISKIANCLTEDIKFNNGLLIENLEPQEPSVQQIQKTYVLKIWDEVDDNQHFTQTKINIALPTDADDQLVGKMISDKVSEIFELVSVEVLHVRKQGNYYVIQEDLGGGRLAIIIAYEIAEEDQGPSAQEIEELEAMTDQEPLN
jgi:hypothetical protein